MSLSYRGLSRPIYVGGQDAVRAEGNIVGKGDLAAQTEQILAEMERDRGGAGVVK